MPLTNPALLLISLISVAFVVSSVRRYIHHEARYTLLKLVVHVVVSSLIALTSFFPEHARTLTRVLGFGENLNTLIFIGFIVVFTLIFQLLRIIERQEDRITKLVQEMALLKKGVRAV